MSKSGSDAMESGRIAAGHRSHEPTHTKVVEMKGRIDRHLKYMRGIIEKMMPDHMEESRCSLMTEQLSTGVLTLSEFVDSEWLYKDSKQVREIASIFFLCVEFSDVDVERVAVEAILRMISHSQEKDYGFDGEALNASVSILVRRITFLNTGVACQRGTSSTSNLIDCLSRIISNFGESLKAEEMADNIVRGLLLPILERPSIPEDITAEGARTFCLTLHREEFGRSLCSALGCMISFLAHKQNISAILAPLVLDVTTEGNELQMENPLKRRLVESLTNILLSEDEHIQTMHGILESACRCLTVALDAICAVNRGKKVGKSSDQKSDPNVLDVPSVARKIRTLLRHKGFDVPHTERGLSPRTILLLLSSVARAYPEATAAHWALFLEKEPLVLANSLGIMKAGPQRTTCLLLSFLQPGGDRCAQTEGVKIATLSAIKTLLSAIPLRAWFRAYSSRESRKSHRRFPISGELTSRLSGALKSIVGTLVSNLRNIKSSSDAFIIELCSLMESMIRTEPFAVDGEMASEFAVALSELGIVLQNLVLKQSTSTHSTSMNLGRAIFSVYVRGMGGTITPKGELLALTRPTKLWMNEKETHAFLSQLIHLILPERSASLSPSTRDEIHNFVMLVLRMTPWVLNDSGWVDDRIAELVRSLLRSKDAKLRCAGLEFMQNYLRGRNGFALSQSVFVSEDFCPYILETINDKKANVRVSSAALYGLFLHSDWKVLLHSSSRGPEGNAHVASLLGMCIEPGDDQMFRGEKVAAVRSEACKAIGNMCTKSCGIIMDAKGISTVVRDVAHVMLIALADKSASVRGMALFAVGNLFLSIKSCDTPVSCLLAESSFPELRHAVYRCLGDQNAKVVGNAIRSIGHILNMIPYFPDGDDRLLIDTFSVLAQKLDLALNIAAGQTINLSWKHRSFAKKHAWGACHTIFVLIQCASTRNTVVAREIFKPLLTQLIRCIRMANELNEKIVVSAVASLIAIPKHLWALFTGEGNILSEGLFSCLVVGFEESRKEMGNEKNVLPPQVVAGIQSLLLTLLEVSSPGDAGCSFSRDEIVPEVMDFLYIRMVDSGSTSSSFNTVATALLSIHHDAFEVSIEQRFSSRAKHELRREQSPLKQGLEDGGGGGFDLEARGGLHEEEDEL